MTDDRAVATRQAGGAVATEAPSRSWERPALLKPYAGGAVVEQPRVDAIATISAGFKNAQGWPEVSRDGTIYVAGPDDQAPGLRAALKANHNKSLTIALMSDDMGEAFHQRFALYSKTRLEGYGDAEQITLINLVDTGTKDAKGNPLYQPDREVIRRAEDPDRYALVASSMSAQSSLYFCLAEWSEDGMPRLVYPDGWGHYRLRFTSLNSARIVSSYVGELAKRTGGRVAGLPLELRIAYQDVAGPDGSRRTVPVWTVRMNPPGGMKLEVRRFRAIVQSGLEQAALMALPAPRPETIEYAAYEGPDVDLEAIEGEIVGLTPSGRHEVTSEHIHDPKRWCQGFMIPLKGTAIDTQAGRRAFMLAATGGRFDSLARFAEASTYAQGNALTARAAEWVNRPRSEQPAGVTAARSTPSRTFDDVFPDDEEEDRTAPRASSQGGSYRTPDDLPEDVRHAAILTGAPQKTEQKTPENSPEISYFPLPNEPDWGSWEAQLPGRPRVLVAWGEWAAAARRLDPTYTTQDPMKLTVKALIGQLGRIVDDVEHLHAERFADLQSMVDPSEEESEQLGLVDAF